MTIIALTKGFTLLAILAVSILIFPSIIVVNLKA